MQVPTRLLPLVFRTWLKEMMSLVRGEPLIVGGADPEQLVKKHHEFRLQIDRQLSKSQRVHEEGRSLIRRGNFMSRQVGMDLAASSQRRNLCAHRPTALSGPGEHL